MTLFTILFSFNKLEFYVAGDITNTKYQRDGIFENEANARKFSLAQDKSNDNKNFKRNFHAKKKTTKTKTKKDKK